MAYAFSCKVVWIILELPMTSFLTRSLLGTMKNNKTFKNVNYFLITPLTKSKDFFCPWGKCKDEATILKNIQALKNVLISSRLVIFDGHKD